MAGPMLVGMAAIGLLAAGAPPAPAAPSASPALERLATSSSSPKALKAEARLRALETRFLGPEHAAEHARVRADIRKVKAARRRAGLRPLLPRSGARRAGARAHALGDPAQVGRWGPATNVPVVAVHAIMLPTGKLMMVQQDANGGVAYIWDPQTGQGHRADPPANVWCGGQVYLADGRILFIGGTLSFNGGDNYSGLNHLYIFDPYDETWTRQVDMRHGRWYPTGTRLPDGRVLITSGWDETGTMTMNGDVEVFTPNGTTGSISVVADRKTQFYPHVQVLPDGRALLAGPGRSDSAFIDLSTYSFADLPPLPESRNGYGGGVLLPGPPTGSTTMLLAGGGSTPNTHRFNVLNPAAGWSNAAPLPQVRRNLNTVLLPDGTLLAVGGNSSGAEGLPQRETLLYSPAADTWTPLAEQSEQRAYHSTALLLPDGRVWSGGDNTASGGGNDGDVIEVFEPPYLFRGPRPAIVTAPTQLAYGAPFSIQAQGSPTRAVLMSPGATTHGNDMNQRHVELSVTPIAGGFTARAPANANLAPPGDYMLFVLDADGVPSVARWLRLGSSTPPPPLPNRPPVAALTFSPTAPQTGQQVTVRDASTDLDGSIVARAWDLDDDGAFDDGTGVNAVRTFAAAGTYTVRLRVTDDDGAQAVATGRVTVVDPPAPPPPPPPPTTPLPTIPPPDTPVATPPAAGEGAVHGAAGGAATLTTPAAGTVRVRASLRGARHAHRHAHAPRGAGTFTGTLGAGRTLRWKLTFAGLTGAASGARLHLGPPGRTGPVAAVLCAAACRSPRTGTATLTAAQAKALMSGGAYVSVRTARNPAGEIRGQIAVAR